MKRWLPTNLRSRLTLWYVAVLAILLLLYAVIVFIFQYAVLTRQIAHDEVQDVETVEGLLFFDSNGILQLRQNYYSQPQSHLLVDRLMEVRDLSGQVLYRSPTLRGMTLGGPVRAGEGEQGFDQRVVRLDDGTDVFLVSHIHGMQGHTLLIRLGYSLAPLRQRMLEFFGLLMIAVPLALVIAGLLGQAVAGRALRPIERMAERASGITASNLHDRLEIANPNDELGHLAIAFNMLLDRLEQAFLQLKRFTADAAHELRTPIAALRTIGEVALEKREDEATCQEALSNILEETSRLNETIDGLLLLARAEAAHGGSSQQVTSLKQIVDEVLAMLEVVLEDKELTVVQAHQALGEAGVRGERALLRTAITNVIHNAIKFSPEHATVRVTYALPEALLSAIVMVVEDEGPGIAPGEHELVFDRFYTSASRQTADQSGTGLGLSVARLVVERFGGTMYFDAGAAKGARCLITLPTVSGDDAPAPLPAE